MSIRSLRIQNFRSYADSFFEFSDSVNLIIGPNGIGKTNLLEAVYVLAAGTSFRVADKDLVRTGAEWFRLDGVYEDHERVLRYETSVRPPKSLAVNSGPKKRFKRDNSLPVVLFEPDMLRILTGSPFRRRQFLNTLISQWFMDGATVLRRYDRVLLQRNNLLKRSYELSESQLDDQLFAWDVSMAELAAKIEEYRHEVVAILNRSIAEEYSRIAHRQHHIEVLYETGRHIAKSDILTALRRLRPFDMQRGYTTIGPHRSDFNIVINGAAAENTASRGEQRSLMLAMKHIEVTQLAELSGRSPLLLLDDVMSELDSTRQKALASLLGGYQMILTTTEAVSIPEDLGGGRMIPIGLPL
ncbi:DNA replication/repair protein RecF [Candidatus Saccharibacteria bacterium]|nr:DNA replication/repair protein RecF [Candidatus Saccharibacteria bacterium]